MRPARCFSIIQLSNSRDVPLFPEPEYETGQRQKSGAAHLGVF